MFKKAVGDACPKNTPLCTSHMFKFKFKFKDDELG